jgi:murein DD-endopeptidase MepM/ murein hydrolase activator NlpD
MAAERRMLTLSALIALVLSAGCGAGRLSLTSAPYDEYASKLRAAGLDTTTLGVQWTAAGESALRSAAPVVSPFAESGYFAADQPTAVAFRLQLERGRRLVIEIGFATSEPGRLFVDLFRSEGNGELRRVASLEDGELLIEYAVERTATYVVRLQPELLRSGRFTLVENTRAAIRTFPVSGLTPRAVQSGFGSQRDSGARSHEGIDIFAPRGTPVVAVADGIAHTDTNGLGGNVVWLRDGVMGATRYYYAHLDRWAIDGNARVREGDVLGYVGNTGNARTTSPHLHFGVYEEEAVDPAPFLAPDENLPGTVVEPALLGTLVRTGGGRTPLLTGPLAGSAERGLLEPSTIAYRLGVSGTWHRLLLPDGTVGYVRENSVVAAEPPLRRRSLAEPLALREKPLSAAAVITTLERGTDVEVFGRFGGFDFVRSRKGLVGWAEMRERPRSEATSLAPQGRDWLDGKGTARRHPTRHQR